DRRGVIADLTCDSDGKIDIYVENEGLDSSLPLHPLRKGESYRLAFFLVGAYQEILGDIHNLFGDTDAVEVRLDGDGYAITQQRKGDTTDVMLDYVGYKLDDLRRIYRARVGAVDLGKSEASRQNEALERGLTGYTYLEGSPLEKAAATRARPSRGDRPPSPGLPTAAMPPVRALPRRRRTTPWRLAILAPDVLDAGEHRMTIASRHRLLALAGAIALACAACGQPPAQPDAQAQAQAPAAEAAPEASPDVHRFSIGSLPAAMLRDGTITLPNDGSIVAMGEPRAEVDALLEAAGEATDPLQLSIQGLLVEAGERVILFDTGAGQAEWADGGRLPRSLQAAGVEPAQVTDVFISHLHGDHVGGLVDGDGRPAFANAR